MKRVLIAGLVHETHTFSATRTTLVDFEELIWLHGESVLARCRGDISPMGGVLSVADELGWEYTVSSYGGALPAGIVDDTLLENWWIQVQQDLKQHTSLDGILLVLHGAMVFESFPDGEGEILRRLRNIVEDCPIAVVLDLHANFSYDMARYGSIFVSYRENPHTDAYAAGMRVARLLDQVIASKKCPQVVAVKPAVLYSPRGTASAMEPMRTLLQMARQLESEFSELLEVCVLPGFAYADVPCAGVSFCVTTLGDPQQAHRLLQPLAETALQRAKQGNPLDTPIDQVMPEAMRVSDGPIGIVEPSDNIGGGTPGDGTGVLQAFVEYKVKNCAVVINDPEAVEVCHDLDIGSELVLPIGGKVDGFHGPTLELLVTLGGKTDGKFSLENPESHFASLVGRHVDMGPSAVVKHHGIYILLTTVKTPPMDLGQLRSQGIIPEQLYMVGIKAAAAYKAAYDPILRASFYVDTPGLGTSDLHCFTYQHIPRPCKPLDNI